MKVPNLSAASGTRRYKNHPDSPHNMRWHRN